MDQDKLRFQPMTIRKNALYYKKEGKNALYYKKEGEAAQSEVTSIATDLMCSPLKTWLGTGIKVWTERIR